MNRLFLVRHGITTWNQDGRYQGDLDVPLSTKGRLQAAAARERLREERFDVCYTSALQRARLTAEIILEEHFCPLHELAELNEMSYGAWQGLLRAEVLARYGEDFARHRDDPLHHAPTGGESRAQFQARVGRAVARIAEEQRDATVLIVAHGGSIRTIVAQYLCLGWTEVRRLRLDNASLTIVEDYDGDGILSLFNDTAHLGLGKGPLEGEPAQ